MARYFKSVRGEASSFFKRRYSFQFVRVLLSIFLDIGKERFADSALARALATLRTSHRARVRDRPGRAGSGGEALLDNARNC
jgi:hypothetical protein